MQVLADNICYNLLIKNTKKGNNFKSGYSLFGIIGNSRFVVGADVSVRQLTETKINLYESLEI